jgi:hypothetical protein
LLVSGTRYNARGYDVRLEVLGSQDSIAVGLDDRLPLRSAEPGVVPRGVPYPAFMDGSAPPASDAHFVEIVAGRRQAVVHGGWRSRRSHIADLQYCRGSSTACPGR